MKGKFADKRQELFNKWEEKSREFIGNFMDLFSRDGRLVSELVTSHVTYLLHVVQFSIGGCTAAVRPNWAYRMISVVLVCLSFL